jgi:hypothetical protein
MTGILLKRTGDGATSLPYAVKDNVQKSLQALSEIKETA